MTSLKRTAALCALLLPLAGCGEKKPVEAERDNSAEVEAYYKANPKFFHFAKPEDVPRISSGKMG